MTKGTLPRCSPTSETSTDDRARVLRQEVARHALVRHYFVLSLSALPRLGSRVPDDDGLVVVVDGGGVLVLVGGGVVFVGFVVFVGGRVLLVDVGLLDDDLDELDELVDDDELELEDELVEDALVEVFDDVELVEVGSGSSVVVGSGAGSGSGAWVVVVIGAGASDGEVFCGRYCTSPGGGSSLIFFPSRAPIM